MARTLNPDTDIVPRNLLQALCAASGVQGGTIHQFDLSQVRWVCDTRPSVRGEGLYALVYTDKDGAEWGLSWTGGPSIGHVRKTFPITPEIGLGKGLPLRWHQYAEPRNREAFAKDFSR